MLDELGDVHNHFLALEKRYYRIYGKYAGRFRLQPHLTKLLQRTHKHWAWIPRDTLDAVIIRIHIGYERFFDWIKKGRRGRRVGPPKFKLRFKCFKHKREFVQVGRWTTTTKPCSDCGYKNENLSLSDRQWRCSECGLHHDRDVNAAINILRAALGPSVEQM